jgi:2-desacetyl-2-hydroxyethyl bacteriochlorophyllide A dehydrogenase
LKSIIITAPKRVEIIDEPMLKPSSDQILLKTVLSGISAGTEMALYRGSHPNITTKKWGYWTNYPIRPGYENVGKVIEVGAGVSGIKAGDRIIATNRHSEYTIAPDATIPVYAKIPKNVTNEEALFAVLATTTGHAIRRARIEYGDSVLVVGQGVVGILAAQHAKNGGAGKVIVTDFSDRNLESALQCGADHAINASREDATARVRELTGSPGADVVIEAAGTPDAMNQAVGAVRDRGRVVILGYHTRPWATTLGDEIFHKELELIASRAMGPPPGLPQAYVRWGSDAGINFSLQLLSQKKLKVKNMITHRFRYTKIASAYKMIDGQKEQFMMVVLEWG